MKTWKYMALALVALLSFAACGDEDDPENTPQGAKYTQTLNVGAEGFNEAVVLKGLKAVPVIKGEQDWAKVATADLQNGEVKVTMTVQENKTVEARSTDLTFVAAPDTLVLTVVQAAGVAANVVDVETTNNEESDQPAMSR